MRNVLPALVVASSLAVGVAAQGPPPQAPSEPRQPPTRTEQPAPTTQKPSTTQTVSKVTISGCIQAAPAAAVTPGGATGAPAAKPAESKFDLASAKVVSGEAVGTAGSAATATRYRLEGDEKTISPHLNHQVEITGSVSPATAGGAGGGSAAPMLKVDSVKMLAAKCS